MVTNTSIRPVPQYAYGSERSLDAEDLIDRLAEELRATGDLDLPHSYYVEEVKLRLAGQDLHDPHGADDAERLIRKEVKAAPSSVFNSWAMPD